MPPAPAPRRFATTRWSLIAAAAGSQSQEAHSALAALCELYWFPVYAFVRRTGVPVDEASDLTQAFFTRVLEKGYFKEARKDRGRFRAFLLTAVRHFLSNERDASRALKRGGGVAIESLDVDAGERRYSIEPVDDQTPEDVYQRRWALTVMDRALARLATRYREPERQRVFNVLRPLLIGREPETYAGAASTLGVTEGALRVALHRLRRHFAASLRDVVRDTVDRAEDVDAELREIIEIVGR